MIDPLPAPTTDRDHAPHSMRAPKELPSHVVEVIERVEASEPEWQDAT